MAQVFGRDVIAGTRLPLSPFIRCSGTNRSPGVPHARSSSSPELDLTMHNPHRMATPPWKRETVVSNR